MGKQAESEKSSSPATTLEPAFDIETANSDQISYLIGQAKTLDDMVLIMEKSNFLFWRQEVRDEYCDKLPKMCSGLSSHESPDRRRLSAAEILAARKPSRAPVVLERLLKEIEDSQR